MNPKVDKRRQIWLNNEFQGALALRCSLYWFFCLCTIFLFVAVAQAFSGELEPAGQMFSKLWKQYSSAVLASVLLLPLVIWDVIKFSHRVAGPLKRLENEMDRLAAGQVIKPVMFREGDFHHSLAKRFNQLAEVHNAQVANNDAQQEELAV